MIIYLMRHGLAERPAPGQEDSTRRLTDLGRADVTRVASALAEGQSGLQYLFSSPYVRAKQTADIVGSAVGIPVEVDARLAPGCTLEGVQDMHFEYGAPMRFITVGHQPDVGYLVQALTGRTVAVREGSLIVIEASELRRDCGRLRAVFAPDTESELVRFLRDT